MAASQLSTSTQKRMKVRPALIADDDDEGIEIVATKPSKKHSLKSESPKLERMCSREHLKTKQQIEDLRNEYGDGWLQCQSASKVQDVMGIQVPVKTTPLKTTEEKLESMFNLGISPVASSEHHTSTPIHKSKHRDFGHSPAEVRGLNEEFWFSKSFFVLIKFYFRISNRQYRQLVISKLFQLVIKVQKQ